MRMTRFLRALMTLAGSLLLCGMPLHAQANSSQAILGHATAFAAGRVSSAAPAEHYSLRAWEQSRMRPTASSILAITCWAWAMASRTTQPVARRPIRRGRSAVRKSFSQRTAPTLISTRAQEPSFRLNGQDFASGNTVWHNLLPGTLCANRNADNGQLLVKFDRAAQRWVLTQNVFTSPYAVCIAISQTATFADNLWYAYQFPVAQNGFPDYSKWGVWSNGGPNDGYFQTWNNFGPGGTGYVGPVMCGYDRAKLLAGDASAEQICFQLTANESSLLPADTDSPVGPPATEDEFFIGSVGAVDNSHLSVYPCTSTIGPAAMPR